MGTVESLVLAFLTFGFFTLIALKFSVNFSQNNIQELKIDLSVDLEAKNSTYLSQDQENNQNPEKQPKQKILFYIYDTPEFQFLKNCSSRFNYTLNVHGKHEDDILFLTRIYVHPSRTKNPEKAKIFIIPVILGSIFRFLSYKFACTERNAGKCLLEKGVCGKNSRMHTMMENAARGVMKSEFFKKNDGKDHLIVSSDFRAQNSNWYPKEFGALVRKVSFGTFEEFWAPILMNTQVVFNYADSGRNGVKIKRIRSRCSIVTPYVNKVEIEDFEDNSINEMKNISDRKIDFLFMGQWNQKGSYAHRRRFNLIFHRGLNELGGKTRIFANTVAFGKTTKNCEYSKFKNLINSSDPHQTIIGKNTQLEPVAKTAPKLTNCKIPASMKTDYLELLSNTKLALIISGDTASTSRIYDAIERGAIPIVVSDLLPMVGLPFKYKVPWERLVYFLSVHSDEQSVLRVLEDISVRMGELEEKQRLLKKYGKEVLWWSKGGSNVVDNLVDEAYYKCMA